MNYHHPIDIYTRAEEWCRQGWSGFEPEADPLNLEE
jgi:hypothetical protein